MLQYHYFLLSNKSHSFQKSENSAAIYNIELTDLKQPKIKSSSSASGGWKYQASFFLFLKTDFFLLKYFKNIFFLKIYFKTFQGFILWQF